MFFNSSILKSYSTLPEVRTTKPFKNVVNEVQSFVSASSVDLQGMITKVTSRQTFLEDFSFSDKILPRTGKLSDNEFLKELFVLENSQGVFPLYQLFLVV